MYKTTLINNSTTAPAAFGGGRCRTIVILSFITAFLIAILAVLPNSGHGIYFINIMLNAGHAGEFL